MNQTATAFFLPSSKISVTLQRASAAVIAVVAAVLSALLAVPFAAWADRHNAAYYAAVEVGQRPRYPAGHYMSGLTLGGLLAGCMAVSLLAIVVLAASRRVRWMSVTAVLLALAALALDAAVPAMLFSPLYGAGPLVMAAGLTVVLAVRHSVRAV